MANKELNREDCERIGCDICKIDGSTEKFVGYCSNVLWLCHKCMDKLISSSEKIRLDALVSEVENE